MIFLLKFLHVMTAVSLLAAVFIGLATPRWHPIALKKGLLHGGLLTGITGLLLVYPRHFTFQTPWIQVAIAGTLVFLWLVTRHTQQKRLLFLVLAALLIMIIHDAVTKSTFLFS